MNIFISESIILCILFTLIVVPSVRKNPIGAIHDYPPAIAAKAIELGLTTEKHKRTSKGVIIVKALVALLIAFLLAFIVKTINHAETFLQGTLTSYSLWLIVNWYDAFILDCLWFCHSKKVIIPGTEGMKEYKDYRFHIKAGCVGTLIGVPVAIFVGIFVMLLS